MNKAKLHEINGHDFSVHFDKKGNIHKIIFHDKSIEPPMKYTLFEINGQMAEVSEVSNRENLRLDLATKEASGRLTISSEREIKMSFEPEKKGVVKNLGLILPFSAATEFHLPEIYNLGRKVDSDMPVGEAYSALLGYNFFLANVNAVCLRFMTKQASLRNANLHISRHPEMFIVTFSWTVIEDAPDVYIAAFSSIEEAIGDYTAWLEDKMDVRKLKDRPSLPTWVRNMKLVLTIDMLRSNWEITHDYDDVIHLAKELKEIGCPRDTLLYVPGWNGAYDSTYPTYLPHPDLGGEEKFKQMIDAIHENGFRVMIHTDAWGVDPYHPRFDEYEKYIVRGPDGSYSGWQTGGLLLKPPLSPRALPPSRPLRIPSERVPLLDPKSSNLSITETSYIPDMCEALFTVGGLHINNGRLKLSIDRRSLLTPAGWFKDHDEYAFPFPFMLKQGKNKIRLEVIDKGKADWSGAWYKLRYCFIPLNPFSTWTHPILHANFNNPEWISIFVGEVASAVGKYDIDAVHVDATVYDEARLLFDSLKEKLPSTVMACEWFNSLRGMNYFAISQGARQSTLGYLDTMRGTSQQGSIPDRSALEELYSWLDKPSPVCNFVKDYIKVYPHLCAADAFVPVGKVCQTYSSRLSPRCTKDLWRTLRDSKRLGYVSGLRLNYRKHGLDEETRKAIREIAHM